MECSTRKHKDTQSMGLVCYHAYSLIGLAELSNGTRLVRIRNTWGHSEWLGAWADGDEDRWTQQVKAQVEDYVDADDGSFYMQLEDFVVHYNRLYLSLPPEGGQAAAEGKSSGSRRRDEKPYRLTQKGYWLPPCAGGISADNPQYLVQFKPDNGSGGRKKLTLTLQIPQAQFAQDSAGRSHHDLCIVVCSAEGRRVVDLDGIIKQSSISRNRRRRAVLEMFLSPRVNTCVVIPCWDDGRGGNTLGDKGSYKLTCESDREFGMKLLLAANHARRGSAAAEINRDLGRQQIVPSELTSGIAASLAEVKNKVQDSCSIM